ncbi:hypothetical protein JFL43_15890 [Viridibacillus sp. YIM B01967]|uniref:Imm-5-like domain-containing protein n=1 Tax=Viridibacillus soli TaxID=2798301 RepID=A0ABS1HA76_9BACL|nr:hypothetical protein [Viridibacillus soli]
MEGEITVGDARKAAFAVHATIREADDNAAIAKVRSVRQAVATAHTSIFAFKSVAYVHRIEFDFANSY